MTADDRDPGAGPPHGQNPEGPKTIRRRPRDRRAQIAAAAAEAFGALGYHGVSMDDIAARLDISSTALYRHYPSKYAIFREEALRLGDQIARAARLPDEAAAWTAAERLEHVIDALIAAAIASRRSAALLRWQSRYLAEDDRLTLQRQLAATVAAIRELLGQTRAGLAGPERAVLATAAMSVLGSISDHHVGIPVRALSGLLHDACLAVARCELPPPDDEPESPVASAIPSTFKHELVLKCAIELFHERGYPNVSVEDIAQAAGLPASSAVYRFYRGKGDILTAAFRRAADQVSGAIAPTIATSDGPEQALTRLIDLYVAGSFAERKLTFVYYAEISNVPADDRTVLRNIQRLNVEEWAKLVAAVRPQLSAAEARVLVHAALALVVDLGQWFGPDNPLASRARVTHLMRVILLGC
ncbi:TetR/AcrR family transcriptional regulator [Nocardia arthritidis]|uniref:TetR family transcriptional regulator n=1 Tax=Nocardia arthritidis TaxID=228602 RepID=A0A6G9YRY7_9NOCA|nr:TetR/AcrR family transcriptional regulator [Nocardia arthritidis]QIS15931.1 TetR family transcriptional regulator [Nocardia arthritidis]